MFIKDITERKQAEERLDYVGGKIEIHSEPGCGTRIVLLAPLGTEPPKA